MAKGLTFDQADALMRQGKGVRRDAWRRWMLLDAYSGAYYEQDAEGNVRVALSVSATGGSPDAAGFTFSTADAKAHDWTDETWETGVTPPVTTPSDAPADVTCSCSDGSTTTSKGGNSPPPIIIYPPWPPSAPSVIPPRTVPQNPPVNTDPTITVEVYQLDPDTNAADSCWFDPAPERIKVGVNVTVTGGPAGLGGLDLRYQSRTKLLGNGFAGYNNATILEDSDRPVLTPGGTITFEVRYYAEGRNSKPALFYWSGTGSLTIDPLCPPPTPTPTPSPTPTPPPTPSPTPTPPPPPTPTPTPPPPPPTPTP